MAWKNICSREIILFLLPGAMAICADLGSISGKILSAAGTGEPVPKTPVVAKNLATQATRLRAPPMEAMS